MDRVNHRCALRAPLTAGLDSPSVYMRLVCFCLCYRVSTPCNVLLLSSQSLLNRKILLIHSGTTR